MPGDTRSGVRQIASNVKVNDACMVCSNCSKENTSVQSIRPFPVLDERPRKSERFYPR
ncbi:hypothetical protein X777_10630 [Ooceraea biroi]|uniref:Uncharacterized protein n=1 Tax=Ooceraea biroi TaxID=2015173 RepID=A0A026W2Y8_OOCBI|nr:hypothetical protein X777_10630 [Ooceraea biroi]